MPTALADRSGRRPRPRGRRAAWGVVGALLVLQGCAGLAPGPKPPGAVSAPATAPATAPTASPETPPRPAALAVERQWLQAWFEGTPVRIEQRSESSFSVEVPRQYCFDTGRSEVEPPLAAVLDKVAQSLQRKPTLRLQFLAAPGDSARGSELAQQRAVNLRKHLLARGAAPQQVAAPTVTQVPAVQLRIGLDSP